MERSPRESPSHAAPIQERLRYPETFGMEPSSYEREIPKAIRDLGVALHRFAEEGSDEEVLEIFQGVYPDETIQSDLREVHRLERVFDAENMQRERIARIYALVLECIVCDVSHVWFPGCSVWRSQKYDDYKRQIDLFMDIPGSKGQPLTLGLDVASGRENTAHKITQELQEYQRGQFHSVKYFASDTDPDRHRGPLSLPRFVVGASQFSVASLARVYGRYLHASKDDKETEFQRLRFHPLGGELYQELLQQLDVAHTLVQGMAKEVPESHRAHSRILGERRAYLRAARKALEKRFQEWEKGRTEYLKSDASFATENIQTQAANDVLEAIQETAA